MRDTLITVKLSYCAVALLLCSVAPATFGQGPTIEGIAASPNQIQSTYRSLSGVASTLKPNALVQQTDTILPHIATGGGWETVVVIVNLSAVTMTYTQHFYDESGRPMQVTFRTFPDGKLITTSAAQGTLPPNASFNFSLFDSTPTLQVGWSSLEYDSTRGRLGGYSAFRLRAGGVINEGLVPFSAYDDSNFMMPFDNIQGFATGIALCNPGANLTSHVHIVAMDLSGTKIDSAVVTLPPGGHQSFVLADLMPSLAGRTGTLGVASDTTRLAAVGIRMNVAGGMTFTSIPVMNWVPGV